MTKGAKRLSAMAVKNLTKPGRHADGDGLYLKVRDTGAKGWVFLSMSKGIRSEIGLGSYPSVSLLEAREKAEEARKAAKRGQDPRAAVAPAAEALKAKTFADAAKDYVDSIAPSFRNAKHLQQWRTTLGPDYCPKLQAKPVADIRTDDVLAILTPIWQSKPETASRIRGRVERVLDYASVRGWREGENPARWRGHLRSALPAPKKLTRGHHAAMPYAEVPTFLSELRGCTGTSARALELLILCASRSGEVRGAVVSEFDLDNKVWTIPAARMKAHKEHRVPLSAPAMELARRQISDAEALNTPLLFPSNKVTAPISDMALIMLLRRMQRAVTAHGFRSSFRDWAGDETSFPREVAEAALAHSVGNGTERAYRRSDALERRRKLMEAWAEYLVGESKVVPPAG